jgi:hypothetical protein
MGKKIEVLLHGKSICTKLKRPRPLTGVCGKEMKTLDSENDPQAG